MSAEAYAEAYAEEQFEATCQNPAFRLRLNHHRVDRTEVVVVDSSTPIGEALARAERDGLSTIAVYDEDAEHGFTLADIGEMTG